MVVAVIGRRRRWMMIVVVIVVMVGHRNGYGLRRLGGLDHSGVAAGKGQQCGG